MIRALSQFAAWSMVLLLVVMVLIVLAVSAVARNELVRDASRVARGVGHGVIEPMLNEGFLAHDPAAIAPVDMVLRNRMRDGSITRIKIWSSDGEVLWSDAGELIGQRFPLRPEVAEVTRTQGVMAKISDLQAEENVLERETRTMVEAYAGLRSTNGQPLLFEVYIPANTLSQDTHDLIWSLAPIALGGLLLFQLGILPLSVSLARRVDRAGEERAHLLRNAVAATDLERRRVAQDLHDGVIQDLAGVSYLLSSVRSGSEEGLPGPLASLVTTAEGIVQKDVRALRSLLTDLYPPDLSGDGLAQGLDDLARQADAAGVSVDLHIDQQEAISTPVASLVYRVVREGLRNVVRHSGASHAEVRLDSRGDGVTVAVCDEGRGVNVHLPAVGSGVPSNEGHMGLRLLRDTVGDVGGTFRLSSTPGVGTTLEVSLPLSSALSE